MRRRAATAAAEPSARAVAAKARRVTRAEQGWRAAAEVIGPLQPDTALCVLTRGQISMIDAIREVVQQLAAQGRPVEASVWTWCIAEYEVEAFEWFLSSCGLAAARLVIDRSAEQRNAALIARWRTVYGADAVRVCLNHAKVATVSNGQLRVALRGSMNLNYNPRCEQFDLSVNDGVYELFRQVEDELPVLAPMATWADAAAASGVQAAFSAEQLGIFSGVTTWAK